MKTISKIFLCIAATLFMFTACEDTIERGSSPADTSNGAQAYFSELNKTSLAFLPDAPTTFKIGIGRNKASEAATVEYTITDKNNVFVLDNSVDFAAGETLKEVEVDFSAMSLGMTATLELKLKAEDATMYGSSSLTISVKRDYKWIDKGNAVFEDALFGFGEGKATVQWAEGTDLFRLKDPYLGFKADFEVEEMEDGFGLSFYLDTLNNYAIKSVPNGFQDFGLLQLTPYSFYYTTEGGLADYCSFVNNANQYVINYLLAENGVPSYIFDISFTWDDSFPGEIPDPYEGDVSIKVDWTMTDAEAYYWGYDYYETEDEYGDDDAVFFDNYEVALASSSGDIVLDILSLKVSNNIALPLGSFEINDSNLENTIRAGYKSGTPLGSYVEVPAIDAILYLVEGEVTIEEGATSGTYKIAIDGISAAGATVEAEWEGSLTVQDMTPPPAPEETKGLKKLTPRGKLKIGK